MGATFSVRLPDGVVIQGIPDGTTKAQLYGKLVKLNPRYQSLIPTADLENMAAAQAGGANAPANYGFTAGNALSNIWSGLKQAAESIPQTASALTAPGTPQEIRRAGNVPFLSNSLIVPLNRLLAGNYADLGKAARLWKQGHPIQAAGYEAAGRIPVVGPILSSIGEQAGTGDIGGAVARGLTLGGLAYLPGAIKEAASSAGSAISPEQQAVLNGREQFLRSNPTGMRQDFLNHLNNLEQTGHMSEIGKMNPKSAADLYDMTRAHMRDFFDKTTGAALKRQGQVGTTLDPVANAIGSLHNEAIESIFPERMGAIDKTMGRFSGKTMNLNDVHGLLTKLNAMNRSLEKMSPSDQAAAENKVAATESLNAATDSLRNHLYSTLDSLGEHGVAEAQKQYGSLAELRDVAGKNIIRGAKAEANKPTYTEALAKAFTRHPGYSAGILTGDLIAAEAMKNPSVLAAGALLPAIEMGRTAIERASVPDRMITKAFKSYSGGPSLSLPTYSEAAHPAGLLGSGSIRLGPSPDNSFVRGIEAVPEPMTTAGRLRALRAGEGVGPIRLGPSPLDARAGSEPTPTGGARAYPSEAQPNLNYGGSVTAIPDEFGERYEPPLEPIQRIAAKFLSDALASQNKPAPPPPSTLDLAAQFLRNVLESQR